MKNGKRRRLGLTVLAALALAACGTGNAEESPTLQTAAVNRGDLRITVEATGTVEPVRSVEVKSKASGEITELPVDVGDEVRAGALLARVDPRDVRNAFDQAQADLEVAKARSDIATAQLARSKELLDSGVITSQEYESAKLEDANSRAALVKAKTNMDLAQLRMGDATITAPLSGTILTRNVAEGQVIQSASSNVSGGTTLFTMADLGQIEVRALVDETDMGGIRAGMPVNVSVEAFPGRTFEGTVEKVEPQAVVNQNVTMFPVIIRLDNRGGLLRPGMNAEVEILISEATDVVLVPNNAIVLPKDVGPAALVLGLDVDNMDLAALTGRGGAPGAAGREGGQGGARAARGGQRGAPGGAQGTALAQADGGSGRAGGLAPEARARLDSVRARVERGEISQDSARVLFAALRQRAGAAGFGDGQAASSASGGLDPRQIRRAVVFVVDSAGVPSPRAVTIGLNDWDNTQVVSGLDAGVQVALIGAAQLQAQQQEFRDRMRARMGGGVFGGGGGPGGRGR